jgi:hypothetical protein
MTPIREMDVAGVLKDKTIKPRNPNMNDFENALKSIKPSVSQHELVKFVEWDDEFGT